VFSSCVLPADLPCTGRHDGGRCPNVFALQPCHILGGAATGILAQPLFDCLQLLYVSAALLSEGLYL
jgi:hypothetical protein